MGNTSSNFRPSGLDSTSNFQADLPKFILQSKIGNGKFMKTYMMRFESNHFVVKVYQYQFVNQSQSQYQQSEEDLRLFASRLTHLWYLISPTKYLFLLPVQMWIKSQNRPSGFKNYNLPIYQVRQHLYANIFDRLSTRPFLEDIEKMWILFQLFKALETCHSLSVYHGDIKPENILCTTWYWVVLTDFAVFKPVTIPDDDPSDFQYYFDTMSRSRCYLAPERFIISNNNTIFGGNYGEQNNQNLMSSQPMDVSVFGDLTAVNPLHTSSPAFSQNQNLNKQVQIPTPPTTLTAAMDVFSLGCTMAEVSSL